MISDEARVNLGGDQAYPRETFLGRLPTESVVHLSESWRVDHYAAGRLIIGEGDQDADLFFVLRGTVRAAVFTLNGKEVAFRDIGQGDCFGEISAIDKNPRAASVVAVSDVVLARLAARDFDCTVREDWVFVAELLKFITGKLRDLSRQVVEYAELTGAQRVRRALLRLAREHRTGLDGALISNPPTQSALATKILVRREVVAREMAELARRGVVMRQSGALHVASIRALEAVAVSE